MTSGQWTRRKRLATVVTMVIVLLLGAIVALTVQQSIVTAKRSAAQALAFGYSQRIVQRLQDAVGPAYMLASLVQQGKGKVDNFDSVGEELLQSFPMAKAVELAPGGVVSQVYPVQGNEKIIGHDLLKDRERNREAHVAVASRQLTVAGPFPLLQGGIGAAGRYPVFLSNRNGRDNFWGFAIVLIRVPELLNSAGILELPREGYRYELCRVPPDSTTCEIFARNSEARLDSPVVVPVNVPNGHWQLSLSPEAGWMAPVERNILICTAIFLAVLLGGIQYLFLRHLQQAA